MAEPRTTVDDDAARRTECWCCGCLEPPARMVSLGNHPEVTVCLRCAHFLHQQARDVEDRDRVGLGVAVRDRLRAGRRIVMDRGWHRSPVVGRLLRRLGRHLP
jgi:hypothetical protein